MRRTKTQPVSVWFVGLTSDAHGRAKIPRAISHETTLDSPAPQLPLFVPPVRAKRLIKGRQCRYGARMPRAAQEKPLSSKDAPATRFASAECRNCGQPSGANRRTAKIASPNAAESEAWIAEDPNYMIDFDGGLILGRYTDVIPKTYERRHTTLRSKVVEVRFSQPHAKVRRLWKGAEPSRTESPFCARMAARLHERWDGLRRHYRPQQRGMD